MANAEQEAILNAGAEAWNNWRFENRKAKVDLGRVDAQRAKLHRAKLDGANLDGADLNKADLSDANLQGANLSTANLQGANLDGTDFSNADLKGANLSYANLNKAVLWQADLSGANLSKSNLKSANLHGAVLRNTDLTGVDLMWGRLREASLPEARLYGANLWGTDLKRSNFWQARIGDTIFGNSDLSEVIGLENVYHSSPSSISIGTFVLSKGTISEVFLRGCGLSDWEIEEVKLYNPDLSNDEVNKILYRMYDLRATQALQISPLFISYSHGDGAFVDKVGNSLTEEGIRYWRDIHDMKSGRIEKQIDQAIRQNPTVFLVLSEHSLASDWVEHEVRTARQLEKELGRDVLCPVAVDESWKTSPWPKRVIEQVMEYNILDFSAWKDDSKFDGMFRKLIDGLELFYKG